MRRAGNILAVIGCILFCNLAGLFGVITSDTSNSAWFESLVKPSFMPPGWIFAPVWTLLYTLMGISLFLLLKKWPQTQQATAAFLMQLLLNAIWTPVFFGLHEITYALIIILLLWLMIVGTIVTAWPDSRAAALLLFPYLAWVSFAVILNGALLHLNPPASITFSF